MPPGREYVANAARDAIVKASDAIDVAESAAKEVGLTNKDGQISQFRAAVRPTTTARGLVAGASAEIIRKRGAEDISEDEKASA